MCFFVGHREEWAAFALHLRPSQLLPSLGATFIACVGGRDPATRVADIAPARAAVHHG